MARTILSLFLAVFLLVAGADAQTPEGRYTNSNKGISGTELRFSRNPDKFEYYFRSEAGLLGYSTGTWRKEKNKLILSGFTAGNLNQLAVASTVSENVKGEREKVVIKYARTDNLNKAIILLNNDLRIVVSGDTSFLPGIRIKTIRINAYLSYEGLLGTPPLIDTLSSASVIINGNAATEKTISLQFVVKSADFARIALQDSVLTIKNSHQLIWANGLKLRKNSN